MDRQAIIRGVEAKQQKANTPDIRVGETVRVYYKIREGNKERIQVFEGLVIGVKRGRTIQGSFTVRKVASGVGVERTFPLHSPHIAKIERVKSGLVRRSKLYFVRRHAQSPKRFRLKDKGIAGTIWEDVAKEQDAIAEGEQAIENTEVAPAEEPVVETVETVENSANEPAGETAGTDGGDAGDQATTEEAASDSGSEPTN
jgi:large subunit ribosomal protein L19